MAEEENKKEENSPPVLKDLGDYLARDKYEAEQRAILIPVYLKALQEDERIREYFKEYDADSVNAFLKHYAEKKAHWMTDHNEYAQWNENHALHWETEATSRLEEIQQKKLFDLQCQWRAEKIELEDTVITTDFLYWSQFIFNCPFLPPITRDEVDLYISYMHSGNFEMEQEWFAGWQDYTGIKLAYNTDQENRNFPEWYDFYNGRKGTGIYMLLPDIRGQKEAEYFEAGRKEFFEKAKKAQQEKTDQRPIFANYPVNNTPFIVSTFEDPETQRFFKLFEEDRFAMEAMDEEDKDDYDEDNGINFDIEMVIHEMERATDIIPVKAWPDFRVALKEAWDKYFIEKTAEALPLAYEQYLMRIETGIPFPEGNKESGLSVREFHRNNLLRGRELKGEPRNFDF